MVAAPGKDMRCGQSNVVIWEDLSMLSKKTADGLKNGSAIRAMFVEGKEMAERFGAENVYDFSLGNPATPAPEAVKRALIEAVETVDPLTLHGYMNNAGFPETRRAVANSCNERFGTAFDENDIVMTVGAAGGLNIVLKAILDPGDEVVVFSPYFGEYRNYVQNFDGVIVETAPDLSSFQPDLADFESRLTEKTKAVIINTPNNPTGVIYRPDTLDAIGRILEKAEEKFHTTICLISDEPYRELRYDGTEPDFLTKYYRNTIVCYSFSKSLSLPGERIGYIAVPKEAAGHDELVAGISLCNRILGFVNAPSLIQKAIESCLSEKTDVAFYDENRKLLLDGLTKAGFTCIPPDGAFYLWMKSPEPDEKSFVQKAKAYHLLLVPGSTFGCGGYVRMAYCVSKEMIERSLPAFSALAKEYGLNG